MSNAHESMKAAFAEVTELISDVAAQTAAREVPLTRLTKSQLIAELEEARMGRAQAMYDAAKAKAAAEDAAAQARREVVALREKLLREEVAHIVTAEQGEALRECYEAIPVEMRKSPEVTE